MSTKSEIFSALPDINFAEKDIDTITEEVIARYEEYTGRSLARSDPIRLFLNAVIMALAQQRNVIDYAGKMNLLAYAEGYYLDHIGANIGVTRLGASSSVTTIQFTLDSALDYDIVIPSGTRLTPDGKIYFATTQELAINAGITTGTVTAQCMEAGIIGNDYVPGQITRLVDSLPYDISARNIDTSSGGADSESDEAFRERIHIAPETFTTAGSIKAYEFYALSADPDICDVSAVTNRTNDAVSPGNVNIYVLMNGGVLPDDDTLAKVLAACDAENVRPDTDYVHVLSPIPVSYIVNVKYWIDSDSASQSENIQVSVNEAVASWMKWQRSVLGRDINPSRLTHDILAAGAVRCEIIEPSHVTIQPNQVAFGNIESVSYMGLEN